LFGYFDNNGDRRLQEIKNLNPASSVLSQFDYTYFANGNIQTEAINLPGYLRNSLTYNYSYDNADQLLSAVLKNGSTTVKSFNYTYDRAGNRTMESNSAGLTKATFNAVNQLISEQSRTSSTFTYDKNGNLINDGVRTFEWDAADRLTAVNIGAHRSEFSYNGLNQRTRIVEKNNGAIISDRHYIWCGGAQPCEERDTNTGTTLRRFYVLGEQDGASNYYYSKDHLGSIREMTDNSGNIVARYDYDPYGRITKVSGSEDAAFGYAGYFTHAPSGLGLTLFRAYDANLGRWISRDPIGEKDSTDLYQFVRNNPIEKIDPLGLYLEESISYVANAVSNIGSSVSAMSLTNSAGDQIAKNAQELGVDSTTAATDANATGIIIGLQTSGGNSAAITFTLSTGLITQITILNDSLKRIRDIDDRIDTMILERERKDDQLLNRLQRKNRMLRKQSQKCSAQQGGSQGDDQAGPPTMRGFTAGGDSFNLF
jgi:RHS repeat-associated protein